MKVGDLVKYKDRCDATGWIGLVLAKCNAQPRLKGVLDTDRKNSVDL